MRAEAKAPTIEQIVDVLRSGDRMTVATNPTTAEPPAAARDSFRPVPRRHARRTAGMYAEQPEL